MVSRSGQSIPEFLVVLALLTAVGLVFMLQLAGRGGGGGAAGAMRQTATNKIVQDPD